LKIVEQCHSSHSTAIEWHKSKEVERQRTTNILNTSPCLFVFETSDDRHSLLSNDFNPDQQHSNNRINWILDLFVVFSRLCSLFVVHPFNWQGLFNNHNLQFNQFLSLFSQYLIPLHFIHRHNEWHWKFTSRSRVAQKSNSCTYAGSHRSSTFHCIPMISCSSLCFQGCSKGSMWCYSTASSTKCWPNRSYSDAHTSNTSWPSGQNLCDALGLWCKARRVLSNIDLIIECCRSFSSSSRNLVSASQDGKLIVWDSYTTNKVRRADSLSISSARIRHIDYSRFTLSHFVHHGSWPVRMLHLEISLLAAVLTTYVQFIRWKHAKAMYVLVENCPATRAIYHAVVFSMIHKSWRAPAIWHGWFALLIRCHRSRVLSC
jgi:hypothetical protein